MSYKEFSFSWYSFLLHFLKKFTEENEQTKVYDHGGQATRGQKIQEKLNYKSINEESLKTLLKNISNLIANSSCGFWCSTTMAAVPQRQKAKNREIWIS